MKKLIFILHFSFFVSLFSLAQQYGWTDISGNLPDFPRDTAIINNGEDTLIANLRSLFFLNDNEGWLTTATIDTGVILHTTNGGSTWEIQTLPFVEHIVAIEMLDPMKGYAASHEGSIFKTTNGGETWAFHGPTFALSLSDMDFPPGSDTGYVCGQNAAIFRITPSGVYQMSVNFISNMHGICFVDPNHGWVNGEGVMAEYSYGSWIAGHSYPSGTFTDVFFSDTLHGWATGRFLSFPLDTAGIIHTSNDSSWFTQPLSIGNTGDMTKVFFLNELLGWSVGTGGKIFSTVNGGQSWIREAEGMTDEWLSGLQFTSANTGYVCGNNMTLLKYVPVSGAEDYGSGETGKQRSVLVWPNPTSGVVTVKSLVFSPQSTFSGRRSVVVKITDLYGNVLAITPCQLPAANCQLDISHLPAGVYFLRINLENRMIVKKIVKL